MFWYNLGEVDLTIVAHLIMQLLLYSLAIFLANGEMLAVQTYWLRAWLLPILLALTVGPKFIPALLFFSEQTFFSGFWLGLGISKLFFPAADVKFGFPKKLVLNIPTSALPLGLTLFWCCVPLVNCLAFLPTWTKNPLLHWWILEVILGLLIGRIIWHQLAFIFSKE